MTENRNPITIGEARAAGYCVKGIKEWHELRGRDFKFFVKNGLDVETAIALNDPIVNHIMKTRDEKAAKTDG